MGLLPILLVSLCAISVYIGVNHIVIAFNKKGNLAHILMTALAYCSLVILVLSLTLSFSSNNIISSSHLFKYQLFFFQAFTILILLLFHIMSGLKQKSLILILTFIILISILITMLVPSRIILSGLSGMEHVLLGNGEKTMIARTGLTAWRVLIDIAVLILLAGSIVMSIRYHGIPARYKYTLFSAVAVILMSLIYDQIAENRFTAFVYLLPFAFFIAMMLFHILTINNIFRNIRINKSVINSEAKLKSFLNQVEVIVVGLDRMGHVDYINPYFLQLTGLKENDVIGKDWFAVFLPLNYSYDVQIAFLELEFHPRYQNPILIKNNIERMIDWYNVQVRDDYGNITGSLSIGVDITDCQNEIKGLKEKLVLAEELALKLESEMKSRRRKKD